MLRWRATVLAVSLFLAPGAGLVAAGQTAASPGATLSGEVVDLACYIGHSGKGETHKSCAVKCAAMGQPVGLLSSDGRLYLLVADHVDSGPYEKARKLAGEQVEMKGEVAAKDGISALTVKDVKKK